MADSGDEDYERRRREKFRRERNDNYERRGGEERRREPWDDRYRENWRRGGDMGGARREMYRGDYDRRRERYSPPLRQDFSPPHKRMRRDWDDPGFVSYGGEGPYSGGPMHGGPMHHWGGPGPGEMPFPPPHFHGNRGGGAAGGSGGGGPDWDMPTQPPMMTFKQFLGQQDDNITDEDAIKKYNDYKLDYHKQQIHDFFQTHKDEECFFDSLDRKSSPCFSLGALHFYPLQRQFSCCSLVTILKWIAQQKNKDCWKLTQKCHQIVYGSPKHGLKK